MQKFFSITILSCLSLLCLVIGLGLFLFKSPNEKIELYSKTAHHFFEKSDDVNLTKQSTLYLLQQSEHFFLLAYTLNPYDTKQQEKIDLIALRKKDLLDDVDTAFLPHKELVP